MSLPDTDYSKLRDEIIGMQDHMAAFQKWKLIAIGSVFAASLGLSSEHADAGFIWALLAIPVVTVCVDLYIWDWDIRMCVIGRFMLGRGSPYLTWAEGHVSPQGIWALGNAATTWSSQAANLAIVIVGCFPDLMTFTRCALVIGGLSGCGICWAVSRYRVCLLHRLFHGWRAEQEQLHKS
jgi:hypothetical protein